MVILSTEKERQVTLLPFVGEPMIDRHIFHVINVIVRIKTCNNNKREEVRGNIFSVMKVSRSVGNRELNSVLETNTFVMHFTSRMHEAGNRWMTKDHKNVCKKNEKGQRLQNGKKGKVTFKCCVMNNAYDDDNQKIKNLSNRTVSYYVFP